MSDKFKSVIPFPKLIPMDDLEHHQVKKGICRKCGSKLAPPIYADEMMARQCPTCNRVYVISA